MVISDARRPVGSTTVLVIAESPTRLAISAAKTRPRWLGSSEYANTMSRCDVFAAP